MPSILISGYYGFDNLGDDTVLYGILSALRKLRPDATYTVLSNQPERTEFLFGIRAVNRWDMRVIIREIRNADLLIMGGGSLLQDVTGPRSILYYLGIVALAKLFRKPVVFYAQGIGPVNKPLSKQLIRTIVNRVDMITVRDDKSYEDLKKFGVKKPPIHVTADPALAIHPDLFQTRIGETILEQFGIPPISQRQKPLVGIAIRKWQTTTPYRQILGAVADRLVRSGYQVVFVPMQFPGDVIISQEIANEMREPHIVLDKQFTFREIASIIANLDLIIGMRLHSLILAAICEKPFVPISYDPKIERFVHRLGLGRALHVDDLETERFMEYIQYCIVHHETHREEISKALEELKLQAEKSGKVAVQFLP
jgi:polysaccharide pyruvyl transferase CsaB